MSRYVGVSAALLLALGMTVSPVQALEITDFKQAPEWYATETVVREDGQDVKHYSYSTEARAISMVDINRILAAYGLSVVDAKRAPTGYIQEVVVGDRGERTFVFDVEPKGMAPAAVDAILAAYGLRVVDGKLLPPAYGSVVRTKDADGKDVEQVVFGTEAYAWSPDEWHRILSAYRR